MPTDFSQRYPAYWFGILWRHLFKDRGKIGCTDITSLVTQVELERMKVKSLENQLAINVKALEDARSKVVAADEDFERFRQQHRRTSEGGLRQEVFRLSAAKAEAEAKVRFPRFFRFEALRRYGHAKVEANTQS